MAESNGSPTQVTESDGSPIQVTESNESPTQLAESNESPSTTQVAESNASSNQVAESNETPAATQMEESNEPSSTTQMVELNESSSTAEAAGLNETPSTIQLAESNESPSRTKEQYLRDDPLMTWVTTTRDKTEIRLLKVGLTLVAENLEQLAIQLSTITDQSGTHALSDYPEALQILSDLEAISSIYAEEGYFSRGLRRLNVPLVSFDGTLNDIFLQAHAGGRRKESLVVLSYKDFLNDFKRPFLGTEDLVLDQRVRYYQPQFGPDGQYPSIIPVVQSSGTGKTRTVMQLSKHRLGMLVSVRPALTSSRGETVLFDNNIPPGEAIVDAVLNDTSSNTEYYTHSYFDQTRRIATWLIALATEILKFYREKYAEYRHLCLKRNNEESSPEVDETIWAEFKAHVGELLRPRSCGTLPVVSPNRHSKEAAFSTPREYLLKDVAESAAHMRDLPQYSFDKFKESRGKYRYLYLEYTVSYFTKDVEAAFKNLVDFFGEKDEYFHLAIDNSTEMKQNLYILLELWPRLPRTVLFVLDTNANAIFTYNHDSYPACRHFRENLVEYRPDHNRLPPSYDSLPQNLALRAEATRYAEIIRGEGEPITHRQLRKWLPKMGRPTLNGEMSQNIVSRCFADEGIMLLLDEIAGHRGANMESRYHRSWDTLDRTIALLGHRMPLVMDRIHQPPLRAAHGQDDRDQMALLPQRLVARHLRLVCGVSARQLKVETYDSSEPLLSLVAAAQFRCDLEDVWNAVFKHIRELIPAYLPFSYARQGEEVGLFCLSIAADYATKRTLVTWPRIPERESESESESQPQPEAQPESQSDLTAESESESEPEKMGREDWRIAIASCANLSEWLKEMFFKTSREKAAASPLLKKAESYWINFTHYATSASQYSDFLKMPQDVIVQSYTRQAAIRGAFGQESWDVIVPIYKSKKRPDGEEAFEPKNVSYIPVRIRTPRGGDLNGATENFAKASVSAPTSVHATKFTIWLDLLGESSPCRIQSSEGFYHLTACGHTSHSLKVFGRLNAQSANTISEIMNGIGPRKVTW